MGTNNKMWGRIVLAVIIFFGISSYSFSQYPSENFTLLSQHITANGSAIDVDFLDNYAFIIDGSTQILMGGALEIVDITDLENPILYKRINSLPGKKILIEEIETVDGLNNYAFVKTNYGIEIIDLKSIDDIPPFNTFYLDDIAEYEVHNSLLYVVLDSSFQIYDLSNISDYANPQLLKQINTTNNNYGLTLSGNYIYLGQEKGIGVIDATDVTNAILLAEYNDYEYACPYDMHIGNGVIFRDVLIANGLFACFQFFMFDLSSPTEPSLIDYSPLIFGSSDVSGYTLDEEYLYYTVIPNQGGLYSVDISDPVIPQSVGSFRNISKAGGASVKTRDNIVFYCGYMNTEEYPMNQQGGLFILRNDLITSIEEVEYIPNKYQLEQNFPNPFNPSTWIEYSIAEDGFVELKIFNLLGKEVAVLESEFRSVGKYKIKFNATDLASGIYFYRLNCGNYSEIKKMILMR